MRALGTALAVAVSVAAQAHAQMLPQQFKAAQGRYEMCLKRYVIELRKVRGKALEPLDEIASAQVGCKGEKPRTGSEDVVASIMECGVARGDGSPDQGCPQ